ncbi:TPA: hypothetical protein SI383_004670 [Escherichia coli]|nr:hypothetical protein [Escherichia coli]HEI3598338.1 hypothetical protein [Escherichia coli]
MHLPDESARVSRRLEYEYHRHNDKLRSDNAGRDVVPEWVQKKPVAAFWVWWFILRVPDSFTRIPLIWEQSENKNNLYARLFHSSPLPSDDKSRIVTIDKWLREYRKVVDAVTVLEFLSTIRFLWSYAEKVNPMKWLDHQTIHIDWAWRYLCRHNSGNDSLFPVIQNFKPCNDREARLAVIVSVRDIFINIRPSTIEQQHLKDLIQRQNDFIRRMKYSYQKTFRHEKMERRVQISALISPEARNALREMAKKNNLTQAEILDKLILSADRLFMQKTAGDYSR